jgi:hypothetical protein
MNYNKDWISITFFYNSNSWQKLVSEAIIPFLAKIETSKHISEYITNIGSLRGDYIELKLHSTNDSIAAILKYAETFFNQFLSNHPSDTQPATIPINRIFLDFPNNTIHYNLYHFQVDTSKDKHNEIFRHFLKGFSKILLKCIKSESSFCSNGRILLMFHLQLALLKASSISFEQGIELVQKKLLVALQPDLHKSYDFIEEAKLEKQRAALLCYNQQLWEKMWNLDKDYKDRLIEAVELCKTTCNLIRNHLPITNTMGHSNDTPFITIIELLMREINKQLGIDAETYVDYLLEHALKDINQ